MVIIENAHPCSVQIQLFCEMFNVWQIKIVGVVPVGTEELYHNMGGLK